jgi:hypothetical protein
MTLLLWACGGELNDPAAPEENDVRALALASPNGLTVNQRFPLAFTVDNPCTPTVESIQLTGEEHLIIRNFLDGSGTEHDFLHFNIHLTAVDGDGVTYTANETHNAHGKTAPGGEVIFQSRNFLRVMSQGPPPNFQISATFRILRNGDQVFEGGETICR